ncbi:MAG: hypothetical protein IJ272_07005 [Clostridia bacterium]|nr:hypothetical protein [Clostridia bacterium]
MKTFGIILDVIGVFGVAFSLVMAFISVASHNPHDFTAKFYRRIFHISLAILAIGILITIFA